jgi:mono/diheme cytochrome c family protein
MGVSIARPGGTTLRQSALVTPSTRGAKRHSIRPTAPALCAGVAFVFGAHPSAVTLAGELTPPVFSQAQADRGADVYRDNCATCHGEHLNDGAFAGALKGPAFKRDWNAKTLGALGQFIQSQMPPGKAGQLTSDQYTDLIAFLISANGVKAGGSDLPSDPKTWERLAASP